MSSEASLASKWTRPDDVGMDSEEHLPATQIVVLLSSS